MGPEAQGLGFDYVIRGVEENSMVGAICDLVERVWSHGLVVRDGKSALWNQLRKHLDRWKEKHPQCSPCKLYLDIDEIFDRLWTVVKLIC
jgi:hypothetical protein